MVEQATVNRPVVGSNPAPGATTIKGRCDAYYFNVTLETMMDRNAIRAYEGKMIPESVLLNMNSMAKWPSYDEGFTKLNFI